MLSLVQSAETGQRGFLLVGRDVYLGPYNAAVTQLPGSLDRISQLVADNPTQVGTLTQLRRVMEEKLDELRSTLDAQKSSRPEAALEIVKSDKGFGLMREVRRIVTAMQAQEDRLLDMRRSNAARTRIAPPNRCGALFRHDLLYRCEACWEGHRARYEPSVWFLLSSRAARSIRSSEQGPPSRFTCPGSSATPRTFSGRSPNLFVAESATVVEDDPLVRRLTSDALRELGYTVFESENATDALAILDRDPNIGLAFTDVVMPDTNGKKLADEAQRRRPGLRVLFTTGYTANSVVHGGILDAGVKFIGKPFTLDQLASKVPRCSINGGRWGRRPAGGQV